VKLQISSGTEENFTKTILSNPFIVHFTGHGDVNSGKDTFKKNDGDILVLETA